MSKSFLLAGVLAIVFVAPARAEPTMILKSVKVDLPTGDRVFPGGDRAAAINNNCVTCHSAGMVLNQPALTASAWAAEVHKMVNVYKAPVSPEDADAVIAYLVATKGKP